MTGARLVLRVLRAEGVPAARDRMLDRFADWRRRRSFSPVEAVGEEGLEAAGPLRSEARAAVLHVLPTPPRPDRGGVPLQLLRRLEAGPPWALLYPFGGGYRLEVRSRAGREAVAYRVPVTPGVEVLHDPRFPRVVRHAARRTGARIVHFEQLVGLPLGSVAELAGGGLRLVLSLHDFGLFCLRPHLLEHPRLAFCHYCREPARCARCLARDWRLEEGFQERRREIAGALLRSADAVVYPSSFLRRTWGELTGGLDPAKQWVVEPPSVTAAVRAPAIRPRSPVRHLAYVGSVQPHKGALVLEGLIHGLARERPDLRWSVYGGGDGDILRRLRRLPGVRLRGYYRAGTLPRLLRRDGVDLALLLSVVPESYSLTLDECLLAGVPVLAFDHGALGERLRALGAGVPVAPEAGGDAALAALRGVLERGFEPEGRAAAFEPPTAAQAAEACRRIYRRLVPEAFD